MPKIKLVVEVMCASGLSPKDGEGSASPYAEVRFDGLKLRTQTKNKDLTPVWNEKLEFNVKDPESLQEECVEISLYSARTYGFKPAFIGRATVDSSSFKPQGEETILDYPLQKGFPIFTFKRAVIRFKVYYYDADKQVKPPGGGGGASAPGGKGAGAGGDAGAVGGGKGAQSIGGAGGTSTSTAPPGEFSVKPSTQLRTTERIRPKLVGTLEYLFVRVEKAYDLVKKDWIGGLDPLVEVKVGNVVSLKKPINPWAPDRELVWKQVFAFSEEQIRSQNVEITMFDKGTIGRDFLGQVLFDIKEVPVCHPSDSPLAPAWYSLESRDDTKTLPQGKVMLSVWKGTQEDKAFPGAQHPDSGWVPNTRGCSHFSPKLWYLRVEVMEAKDLKVQKEGRIPEVVVRVSLGNQAKTTEPSSAGPLNNPSWKRRKFLFVAAERFSDEVLKVEVLDHVASNKDELIASVKIPLDKVPRSVKAHLDDANNVSRSMEEYHPVIDAKWYELERKNKELKDVAQEFVGEKIKGQTTEKSYIHLNICLEGGYHVLDEFTQYTSDTRPSDRKLWKSPVATLELGIRGATGLPTMKERDKKGRTDAFCVAKYGQKWVRTRTVLDSLEPQWHEQYLWNVYDLCTMLTVGVFDNGTVLTSNGNRHGNGVNGTVKHGANRQKDTLIGKVRIRLSTLGTGSKGYSLSYPLIGLEKSGVKKRGELLLGVRLTCLKKLDMMLAYIHPLLPKQHYIDPIDVPTTNQLRTEAMNIIINRLEMAEPPISGEVVAKMLDIEQYSWSLRRSKAHWHRISKAFGWLGTLQKWFDYVRAWKNTMITMSVCVLYIMLVSYPEHILPIVFFYMFLIGAWRYRFRAKQPAHMDVDLSLAKTANPEELAEELDRNPSAVTTPEVIYARYDALRRNGEQVMRPLGEFASQLERFDALLTWRDPQATLIFITFCLIAAIVLYVTPFQLIAIVAGLYIFRHPRFRKKNTPSYPINFFKRLPTLADTML